MLRPLQIATDASSTEIAAQHQRGRAVFVIALPAADFVESGATIQPASRRIVLTDFEVDGADAKTGEAPQVQIKELPG